MAIGDFVRKYRPHIVFTALALAVLLPLLKPGFVLTLDMVFTPHIRVPDSTTSSFLFYATLHVLNSIIPADVLQKMVLFTIIFLSGFGMHRLVKYSAVQGDFIEISAYIGGTLYAVNPYTYDRFMAGQFAVLLGYGLLPFFTKSLISFMKEPSVRLGLIMGGWMVLIGIVSLHTLGLVAVLLLVGLALSIWQFRHSPHAYLHVVIGCVSAVAIFLVASWYWLVPFMLGRSTAARAVASFTNGDNQAFATLGDNGIDRLLHVLRLQGFWPENTHTFVLPQAHLAGWGIIMLVLWLVVAFGIVTSWRRGRSTHATLFAFSAVLAAVIALGSVNPFIGHIVPLFKGFREPHKFVGLVALAYAYFAACGIDAVLTYLQARRQTIRHNIATAAALLLPIALTPSMFWGFGAQLHVCQYPPSWSAMNQRLDADTAHYQVLFLPWHLYMYYRFADRIIMNPAPNYFDKPILSSNDPEFGAATPDKPDTNKTLLGKWLLPKAGQSTTLGAQLKPLHIKYILLDKDNDYQRYIYLDKQTDLQLISDNTNFKLYRNLAYKD